ncbi:MAG: HAD family hydrolase [Nitrospinae bacterium]|nr:HAD family hydrolase [Nitrospinota bacterium]
MMRDKAAFLDRDGTINVEKGYINNPDDVVLIPGSAEAVRLLNKAGYAVFGVSNQSGVARGYFSVERAQEINKRVLELLSAENAEVREIFICPHHPSGTVPELAIKCECRKPAVGMITSALKKYNLAPSETIVVGDKICDVELGINAKAKTALVATGYGAEEMVKIESNGGPRPHIFAKDLLEAVRLLLR